MIQARRLGGRVVGGRPNHKDQRYHAVKYGRYQALCGAKPHRNSQGWAPGSGRKLTCKKCIELAEGMESDVEEIEGVAI